VRTEGYRERKKGYWEGKVGYREREGFGIKFEVVRIQKVDAIN
jgi:hypothetical protein